MGHISLTVMRLPLVHVVKINIHQLRPCPAWESQLAFPRILEGSCFPTGVSWSRSVL